jgi:hypothetical protein
MALGAAASPVDAFVVARHRLGWFVLFALIAAACAGGTPSSPASPPPSSAVATSPSPAAPSPSSAVVTSPGPPTPVPTPMTVREYVSMTPVPNDASAVAIRGWLDRLPSIGWEAPYIEPAWLAYPPDHPNVALWQRGPGGDAMCGGASDCAFLVLHLAPDSTIKLGADARWVDVVGHRNDPEAETCHYVFGEPWPGPTPANTSAVEHCLEQFVVVELQDAPGP